MLKMTTQDKHEKNLLMEYFHSTPKEIHSVLKQLGN